MKIRIYVEGATKKGAKDLKIECRKAFSKFFANAGLVGHMPSVKPCGSRKQAFDDFQIALQTAGTHECPILLVDSEGPVAVGNTAWRHLSDRDKWSKPPGANDNQAHLMVQCMENWFLADKEKLVQFYESEFNSNALPKNPKIEDVRKEDILNGLKRATRRCKKARDGYDKGDHSFHILAQLDPNKVTAASPHAKLLVDTLKALAT